MPAKSMREAEKQERLFVVFHEEAPILINKGIDTR